MTKSEYQELVEFLGPKFDKIDERFESIDRRFDDVKLRFDQVEECLTRIETTALETRLLLQSVAEGVTTNREVLTREFAAVRAEMAQGFRLLTGTLN
jgi:hypothetical protein